MLSDFQQTTVWESWLAAEIRAAYFAELVQRFQSRQRFLVVGSLLLTSGATITLLTTIVPPNLIWIKPTLTLLAAGLSLWSLVAKNERSSIECADLHLRWNTLAMQYETLWSNMYAEDAAVTLMQLRAEETGGIQEQYVAASLYEAAGEGAEERAFAPPESAYGVRRLA
jgi:hypothetical protein